MRIVATIATLLATVLFPSYSNAGWWPFSSSKPQTFIAVYERERCNSDEAIVKVLFVLGANGWEPLRNDDQLGDLTSLNWFSSGNATATFKLADSQKRVKSANDFSYQRDRWFKADGVALYPAPNTTLAFSVWCLNPTWRPGEGSSIARKPPVTRPVVLTTTRQGSPNGSWKPYLVPAAEINTLSQDFGMWLRLTKSNSCSANSYVDTVTHSTIQASEAYIAGDKNKLIALKLDPNGYACEPEYESNWPAHWFLVGQDGSRKHLGANRELVEIGDYDADSSADFLFFIHGENYEDGYVIESPRKARWAEYLWRDIGTNSSNAKQP